MVTNVLIILLNVVILKEMIHNVVNLKNKLMVNVNVIVMVIVNLEYVIKLHKHIIQMNYVNNIILVV